MTESMARHDGYSLKLGNGSRRLGRRFILLLVHYYQVRPKNNERGTK